MADGDVVPVKHSQDKFADQIVEAQLALVHQLQDAGDHERLGVTTDAHVEVGRHRLSGLDVLHAECPQVNRVSTLPDPYDHAGHVRLGKDSGNRLVELRLARIVPPPSYQLTAHQQHQKLSHAMVHSLRALILFY